VRDRLYTDFLNGKHSGYSGKHFVQGADIYLLRAAEKAAQEALQQQAAPIGTRSRETKKPRSNPGLINE
jgi:hypothetical protein